MMYPTLPLERLEIPTIATVLLVHDKLVDQYGGGYGVRDMGLLESALARPKQILAFTEDHTPDLCALAASLCYAIAKNHAFIDGNKRTAFVISLLFMIHNFNRVIHPNSAVPPQVNIGYSPDVVAFMEGIVENRISEAQAAEAFREHLTITHIPPAEK